MTDTPSPLRRFWNWLNGSSTGNRITTRQQENAEYWWLSQQESLKTYDDSQRRDNTVRTLDAILQKPTPNLYLPLIENSLLTSTQRNHGSALAHMLVLWLERHPDQFDQIWPIMTRALEQQKNSLSWQQIRQNDQEIDRLRSERLGSVQHMIANSNQISHLQDHGHDHAFRATVEQMGQMTRLYPDKFTSHFWPVVANTLLPQNAAPHPHHQIHALRSISAMAMARPDQVASPIFDSLKTVFQQQIKSGSTKNLEDAISPRIINLTPILAAAAPDKIADVIWPWLRAPPQYSSDSLSAIHDIIPHAMPALVKYQIWPYVQNHYHSKNHHKQINSLRCMSQIAEKVPELIKSDLYLLAWRAGRSHDVAILASGLGLFRQIIRSTPDKIDQHSQDLLHITEKIRWKNLTYDGRNDSLTELWVKSTQERLINIASTDIGHRQVDVARKILHQMIQHAVSSDITQHAHQALRNLPSPPPEQLRQTGR